MCEHTPPNAVSATADSAQGDIGRRIAQRREELGLTREETAFRAGTAPGYVQYLEEQSTAMPGTAVLIRLADALSTSVTGPARRRRRSATRRGPSRAATGARGH